MQLKNAATLLGCVTNAALFQQNCSNNLVVKVWWDILAFIWTKLEQICWLDMTSAPPAYFYLHHCIVGSFFLFLHMLHSDKGTVRTCQKGKTEPIEAVLNSQWPKCKSQVTWSMISQWLPLTFDLTVTSPTCNKYCILTMLNNVAWQATSCNAHHIIPCFYWLLCFETAFMVKVKSISGQAMIKHDQSLPCTTLNWRNQNWRRLFWLFVSFIYFHSCQYSNLLIIYSFGWLHYF